MSGDIEYCANCGKQVREPHAINVDDETVSAAKLCSPGCCAALRAWWFKVGVLRETIRDGVCMGVKDALSFDEGGYVLVNGGGWER